MAASPTCCIYTVLYGTHRDLAARSLWSYRQHAPAASIVAVCLDGPTETLRRTAERERIDLLDLSGASLSASWDEAPYLTVTMTRFIDVPPLLPRADCYLMVDADTICLRPPPVERLCASMAECGQTFAAAPEANTPAVERIFVRQQRIFEAFHLTETVIDPTQAMVNAGVVFWRCAEGHQSFPEEYTGCLRYLREQDAEDALFFLPVGDQALVNVLAQRHAGSRFRLLDADWNERRALHRHSVWPDFPTVGMRDAIIWHCPDSFEALFAAHYPDHARARR